MAALSQGGSLGTQIFGLPGSIDPTTGQVVGVPASAINDSGIQAAIAKAQGALAGVSNPLALGGALGGQALGAAATGAGTTTGTAGGTIPTLAAAQAGAAGSKVKATQGWYVFIGILAAVFLSNTPIGPVILGLESVALMYQLGLLLEHK